MKTAIVMFSATSLSTRWLHSSYKQRCKRAMSGKNWIARRSGSCQTNFVIKDWNKEDIYVTVLCRNWRLFCLVFQSHHCLQSAVLLNFRKGGAHMRFVEYSCIYEACMSPALNGSKVIEIHDRITFDFLHGNATITIFEVVSCSVLVLWVSYRILSLGGGGGTGW